MHFGRVDEPRRMAADLHRLIDEHVRIALEHRQAGARGHQRQKGALRSPALEEARRQQWRLSPGRLLEVFRVDFELNAQGLGVRLDAQRR
jgi:hydroxyacylglutathione hydrolase